MGEFEAWNPENVQSVVHVEPIAPDRFVSVAGHSNASAAIFGGQYMGLALQAAQLTAQGKAAHAASGFFLRGGNPAVPLELAVERTFDGRSFAGRRVTCTQSGLALFNLEVSLQAEEAALAHAIQMPDVPAPEACVPIKELAAALYPELPKAAAARARPPAGIELRPTGREWLPIGEPRTLYRRAWVRLPNAAGATDDTHRSLLAWVTDYFLGTTAYQVHEKHDASPMNYMVSLNQSIWFHHPVRMDHWLLFDCSTPVLSNGRGTGRADFFDQSGRIIGSATQEALIRPPK